MDLKEQETLAAVSDATVQEQLKVEVDIRSTNRFHALLQSWGILPKKRVFMLQPITMGSLIRISKLLLKIDMNLYDLNNLLDSNYKAIEAHAPALAEIVAIALQNSRQQPSQKLIAFILNNFTSKEMMGVLGLVVKQMDLSSFMSSIISVKGMNILESKTATAEIARNNEMSPSMTGSLIALGQQSAE